MMASRRWIIGIAALLVACSRDRDPIAPPPVAEETTAWLSISAATAQRGDTVSVLARARGEQSVGSFTARLRYDDARFRMAESVSLDGMRAINATTSGLIVVAGAAPDGFADDQLFAIRFVALADGPVAGLALEIAELTGVEYDDRRSRLTIRRELRVEDLLP